MVRPKKLKKPIVVAVVVDSVGWHSSGSFDGFDTEYWPQIERQLRQQQRLPRPDCCAIGDGDGLAMNWLLLSLLLLSLSNHLKIVTKKRRMKMMMMVMCEMKALINHC